MTRRIHSGESLSPHDLLVTWNYFARTIQTYISLLAMYAVSASRLEKDERCQIFPGDSSLLTRNIEGFKKPPANQFFVVDLSPSGIGVNTEMLFSYQTLVIESVDSLDYFPVTKSGIKIDATNFFAIQDDIIHSISSDVISGNCNILPEMIILPEAYDYWREILYKLTIYRAAPLRDIFSSPLELPFINKAYSKIIIPNHGEVSFLATKPKPDFKATIEPLMNYLLLVTRAGNEQLLQEGWYRLQKISPLLKVQNEAPEKKVRKHPSGFEYPSVQTKIREATAAFGWGIREAAAKKLRNYIANNPNFAKAVPNRKGYYWFNTEYPLAENLPKERIQKDGRKNNRPIIAQ